MAKNKVYSIILSLLVAFGLWLYVINNVSQETDYTFYNIPVVRAGEAVLTERNMMVTAMSNTSVSVNLAGARSELNKIDSSNTSAVVDLSRIEEPGEDIPLTYTMSYPSGVTATALEMLGKEPSTIFVDVDYRRTAEIPVVVKWAGTRTEDYIYDTENYTLDMTTVSISGPAAVVDTIAQAVIEVDLTERAESISEGFRYTLCDLEGNPVDAKLITTNVEEVRLDAQIHRIQEVNLVADVIYGGGATASNTTIRLQPETIRVSGGDAVLKELGDSFTVCTINLAEIERSNKEGIKYTISLPEGVTNQTGVTEVTVTVEFRNLRTREFQVEDFQMLNLPEGLAAEIISANLTVKVRGPEEEIAKLEEKDIAVAVDFTNAEVGTATYKASISISDEFPNVGALKTSSVSATVTAIEE